MNDSLKLFLRILDQYVDAKIRLAENEKRDSDTAEHLLNYEVEHIEDTKTRLGTALELLVNTQALEVVKIVTGINSAPRGDRR